VSGEGLGEFGRIRRFFAPLAGPGGLELRDDAALLACGAGRQLVVTVDAIVAGVHYLPDDPPDLVARKLLRVNLSDLAAMGARPRHYLLTTALPAALDDHWVARFAAGLAEDQRRYGIDLLGGDSVATEGPAVLSLTAIGDAFLGLAALRGGYPDLLPKQRAALIARFQLPEPRVGLGPRLAGIAHAMCDVSDGLAADLGHICEASQVAATVALAQLPLSPAARRVVAGTPDLPARLAAAGDDYELLFTAPPNASDRIHSLSAELRLPITAIGTIDSGAGVRLVDADGKTVPVTAAGYRHF
jgi:thiamine-monophosphate kinase